MKNSKKIMAASLLIAAGYAGIASAHTQIGAVGNAASGAAATDVYVVTCYDDGSGPAARLFLQVKETTVAPAPLVSIQAQKGAASSTLSTDPVNGDANYSPAVYLVQGTGDYTLKVNKPLSATKGARAYIAQFHCQTAGGIHTGTVWYMSQNQ